MNKLETAEAMSNGRSYVTMCEAFEQGDWFSLFVSHLIAMCQPDPSAPGKRRFQNRIIPPHNIPREVSDIRTYLFSPSLDGIGLTPYKVQVALEAQELVQTGKPVKARHLLYEALQESTGRPGEEAWKEELAKEETKAAMLRKLNPPGRPPKDGKGSDTTITTADRGRAYILRRLARDRPDLLKQVESRKLSARKAGQAAGFVKPDKPPLDQALSYFRRLTAADQAAFRAAIGT